jgi:hypothetical protein
MDVSLGGICHVMRVQARGIVSYGVIELRGEELRGIDAHIRGKPSPLLFPELTTAGTLLVINFITPRCLFPPRSFMREFRNLSPIMRTIWLRFAKR